MKRLPAALRSVRSGRCAAVVVCAVCCGVTPFRAAPPRRNGRWQCVERVPGTML